MQDSLSELERLIEQQHRQVRLSGKLLTIAEVTIAVRHIAAPFVAMPVMQYPNAVPLMLYTALLGTYVVSDTSKTYTYMQCN